ncbi:glycoside hydrolase family 3 C-terminal domain-containing protein [Cupriavidus basilensis]
MLETWYAGTEGGHAIADVLFGDYNPSGKLPISFPRLDRTDSDLLQPSAHRTSIRTRQATELHLSILRGAGRPVVPVRLRAELYGIQRVGLHAV